MKRFKVFALALVLGLAASRAAVAQSDEIQVYDGGLAPIGTFNLTWHNNYIADGIAGAPAGMVAADKSFNGVAEWALGVTNWFEAGLYLPLYSHDDTEGWGVNGMKLRTLFAVPGADDRKFFYGANFEFSYNAKRWDDKRITSEVRPIVGWHLHPVDVIINPILDTRYQGGLNALEVVPSFRLAYNANAKWALAAEEYSDFGQLGDIAPSSAQSHQLFGVIDHTGGFADWEAGVGMGLTDAADNLTFKLILSKDLHSK